MHGACLLPHAAAEPLTAAPVRPRPQVRTNAVPTTFVFATDRTSPLTAAAEAVTRAARDRAGFMADLLTAPRRTLRKCAPRRERPMLFLVCEGCHRRQGGGYPLPEDEEELSHFVQAVRPMVKAALLWVAGPGNELAMARCFGSAAAALLGLGAEARRAFKGMASALHKAIHDPDEDSSSSRSDSEGGSSGSGGGGPIPGGFAAAPGPISSGGGTGAEAAAADDARRQALVAASVRAFSDFLKTADPRCKWCVREKWTGRLLSRRRLVPSALV